MANTYTHNIGWFNAERRHNVCVSGSYMTKFGTCIFYQGSMQAHFECDLYFVYRGRRYSRTYVKGMSFTAASLKALCTRFMKDVISGRFKAIQS